MDGLTALLLTGIGSLVTNNPAYGGPIGELCDAAVVIEGDRFAWVGPRQEAPTADDALEHAVIPGFVDSHSHLVFAGDEQLAANIARLISEMCRQGTTTVEIKSGYALTREPAGRRSRRTTRG